LTIDLLSNWIVDGLEFLSLLLVLVLGSILVALEPLLKLLALLIDLLFLSIRDLVFDSVVLDHRLDLIDVLLEVVLGLDLLLSLLISLLVLLGLFDQSVDFLLRQSTLLVRDGDVGGLSGSFVLSSDGKDTVGVKVEGNFNLRNSSWSRGDSVKVEFT
jgi:hypothetical protein